jgi:hypothetical protein
MDERAGHYDIGIGEIGAAKPGGRTKLLHRVQASARLRQATLFPVGADMGGAVKMTLVDYGGDFLQGASASAVACRMRRRCGALCWIRAVWGAT